NNLTSVDFLDTLLHPEKLEVLEVYDSDPTIKKNNISPTTLDFLRTFANLKDCKLGKNSNKDKDKLNQRPESGTYNKFYGSLEPIKNLTKLEEFCISSTDVEEGLEYIPIGIAKLSAQKVKEGENAMLENLIDCQPLRDDAKLAHPIGISNKIFEREQKKTVNQSTQTVLTSQELEQQQKEIQELREQINKLRFKKISRYYGVIIYVRIFEGELAKGQKIKFATNQQKVYQIERVGVKTPKEVLKNKLVAGEIAGYQEIKPNVYSNLYPSD
ncbi:13181_t:CDS:2, partial [Ambispora gerdemannii]